MAKPHPDAKLIEALGGPAALARRLGLNPDTGTQRVHNWKTRGIPALIRLNHPEVFATSEQDEQARAA